MAVRKNQTTDVDVEESQQMLEVLEEVTNLTPKLATNQTIKVRESQKAKTKETMISNVVAVENNKVAHVEGMTLRNNSR